MFKEGDIVEYKRSTFIVTRVNKNGSVSVNYAAGSGKKGWAGSISAADMRKVRKISNIPARVSFTKIENDFKDQLVSHSEHDAYSKSFYDEHYEIENSENIVDNYVFFPAYHATVGIWGIKKATRDHKIVGFYKLGYTTREDADKAAQETPKQILRLPHNVEHNTVMRNVSHDGLLFPLPTNDPDGPWFVEVFYKNIIADSYDFPHLTDGWQLRVHNFRKKFLFNDYDMYGLVRPMSYEAAVKVKNSLTDIALANTASKNRYIIDKNGAQTLRVKGEPLPTGVIRLAPWNPHDTVF